MTKVNIETLNDYKSRGLLRSQKHNELPLLIWNYTEKVQYEDGLWDDITLMCRGLVTDHDGNIIARPFKKFFNIEEGKHTPTDSFEIYEKMDGSLGILFNYEGEWIIATRGSFHSEQANKAMEILRERYSTDYLDPELTHLFEIIYPENRIVCVYDDTALVLLGCSYKCGREANIEAIYPFPAAKKYDFKDYKEIQKLNIPNKEGFVVRFSNGDRCKIKFADYVQLHKIISNITEKAVWELIYKQKPIEYFLDVIPDEFHEQVKTWYSELTINYEDILDKVGKEFETLGQLLCGCDENDIRKKFAISIKDNHYKGLLFKLLDNKSIHDDICKLIKPKENKND